MIRIAKFFIRNLQRHAGRRCAAAAFVALALFLTPDAAFAKGTLPPEVQKTLSALLVMKDPAAPVPDKKALETFLDYTTSPVNLKGIGEKAPFPAKEGKAAGILWRSRVRVPLATMLEYLYNPDVPTELVYPASIRHAKWQPGSDILGLATPLWKQLGQHAEAPLVLRGAELEEITPDTNSGSYYKYMLDRVLLLTEYQGQQMLISVSVQKGKSDVGKKAAIIGDYANWDYVYSDAQGATATGIGWAETFIYTSASVIVFYEDAPGSKQTGYAMYRWMDAGWSGMNMVKQHHIEAGAERSFTGIKAFMESPKRPSPSAVASYTAALRALDLPALQARFAPYSAKVEELGATDSVLKTDDFQKIIKDGGYGKSLSKDAIVSALSVNFIKEKLGKPLLAGSLDGNGAAAADKPAAAGANASAADAAPAQAAAAPETK